MKNTFYNKSFISTASLTQPDVSYIFGKMRHMRQLVQKNGYGHSLRGRILNAFFYEPSTRTFNSFAAAMQRLGGHVVPNQNIQATSVVKGESLTDTMHVIAHLSDCIVLRHPETGAAAAAATAVPVPVINGGDGPFGEHPAHGLHDLWTIHDLLGKLDGLHIVMVGDLAHYRNVTSLAKLFALYRVHITFVAAKPCAIRDELRSHLQQGVCSFVETRSLNDVIADADVLYVTRVKKEYMKPSLYHKIKDDYIIDEKLAARMKKNSLIMHPLPRVHEITTAVDADPRAIYLTDQLENALYGKMALLEAILQR